MKIKVSEAKDETLNYLVAQAMGMKVYPSKSGKWMTADYGEFNHRHGAPWFCPSESWAQGGPIIEREKIEWQWIPAPDKAHQYGARKPSLGGLNRTFCMDGPTPLIAAMRCYVASKLGDEVEVPDGLN